MVERNISQEFRFKNIDKNKESFCWRNKGK